MKLSELNKWDQGTLEVAARCFLDDYKNHPVSEFTDRQYLCLRSSGYVIGPNDELLMLDQFGKLRECAYGIPCRYLCGGLADGKCSQHPFPKDGVPTGKISHEEERLPASQKDAQTVVGKEAEQQAGILQLPEASKNQETS